MTLADILSLAVPGWPRRTERGRRADGSGMLRSGGRALVIGVADRTAVGVDEAIRLSGYVLAELDQGKRSDPRPRGQRQPAHEQARRASGPERISGPSRQVPHPCGHAWPADHRHSVRPLGCRGVPRDGAGDPRAGGGSRRRAGGDGSAVDGQGDQALDRGSAGEGEVDAGVRSGAAKSCPDGRGSRHLGRCAFPWPTSWSSCWRPCRMRATGGATSARSVAAD